MRKLPLQCQLTKAVLVQEPEQVPQRVQWLELLQRQNPLQNL